MRCYACNTDKDLSEFNKNARVKNGLARECRDCKRVFRQKFQYKLNSEQEKKFRNAKTCEICGIECKPYVDHDHASGKVRGFICQHCNTALGMAKEDVSILEKMINYLKGHS